MRQWTFGNIANMETISTYSIESWFVVCDFLSWSVIESLLPVVLDMWKNLKIYMLLEMKIQSKANL